MILYLKQVIITPAQKNIESRKVALTPGRAYILAVCASYSEYPGGTNIRVNDSYS
ncbi:MAG: hypothetical protein K6U80_13285 [Firmicutes bacterium]|nr:hypothetical protein [Bacillota bacterium]